MSNNKKKASQATMTRREKQRAKARQAAAEQQFKAVQRTSVMQRTALELAQAMRRACHSIMPGAWSEAEAGYLQITGNYIYFTTHWPKCGDRVEVSFTEDGFTICSIDPKQLHLLPPGIPHTDPLVLLFQVLNWQPTFVPFSDLRFWEKVNATMSTALRRPFPEDWADM